MRELGGPGESKGCREACGIQVRIEALDVSLSLATNVAWLWS